MPRYQYCCKNCDKEFTVTYKMSEYQSEVLCDCGELAKRKTEDMVCGISIDTTGDFYRKCN